MFRVASFLYAQPHMGAGTRPPRFLRLLLVGALAGGRLVLCCLWGGSSLWSSSVSSESSDSSMGLGGGEGEGDEREPRGETDWAMVGEEEEARAEKPRV